MARSSKVTFEVPRKLKQIMNENPDINWSAVFREAIERKARAARIAKQIQEEEEDPRVQAFVARLKRGVGERARRSLAARGR